MNLYLTANDITDPGKRRAVLLSVCGAKTYHIIRDLVGPSKPIDLEYDEIVTKVQEHYNPTPVVTVQRYKFNFRLRQPEESVTRYVCRSPTASSYSGDSLNDMFRIDSFAELLSP